ncbi:MAG: hypothetical protein SCK28_07095 [Bacillota bacterium]|nr:hypothetical protein [Bacillota bacterium]
MCNKLKQQDFYNLFDRFFYEEINEFSTNRLKQQLARFPKEAFAELLLNYYAADQKVNGYLLEKRLFPLAKDIYLGLIIFIDIFEQVYLTENKEKSKVDQGLPYLRRFCRAMLLTAMKEEDLPLTGRKRIETALKRMIINDHLVHQLKLMKELPFDGQEVLLKLKNYLQDADVIADLPDFSQSYFSKEEIEPIWHDLENWTLNKFSRKYITSLLSDKKKQQIRRNLQQVIYKHPVISQAKQAYAIYLTLDMTGYDWVDHPFIRRIIGNSFLESKVLEVEEKSLL